MFRATLIASEESLPVLGAATIASNSPDEVAAVLVDDTTSLKQADSKRLNYGLTVPLPSKQYKYPLAVPFILATKFFEAFAANGIRTILALYLRDDLFFSENFSTVMLHIFNFFGQFCPIFGAILADSYFGNVRTIAIFCVLYAFGWLLLILTSIPNLGISLTLLVTVSLLFIAIGNGSIRACITSLGAIQFKIPEQARQLAGYFSLYYFVYYIGIFLSKILPPFVRANTTCFNKSGCYAVVFGTLGSSFFASWCIFSLGKLFYKPEKIAGDNILVKFYGCIKHALVVKWSRINGDEQPTYWLHNAIGRYDENFVNDVAKVLRISKLFIPLPIYFALLAQQDSSWTFQASQMNTTIGSITIQPDQAKAVGPIFLFILIPLWQYACTPLMKRFFHWELKPLHSVTVGGICSAFSFVCAAILQEFIFIFEWMTEVNFPAAKARNIVQLCFLMFNKHSTETGMMNAAYKEVNIIWQMPQFLLIMLGELLLSIPGLQFAFTHAPVSMKSVVTAAWFLNNAFGNLIVIIVTEIDIFNSQSTEYLFYAVIMFISIIIFTLLAYDYELHERIGTFYSNSTERSTMSIQQQQQTEKIEGLRLRVSIDDNYGEDNQYGSAVDEERSKQNSSDIF